MGEDVRFIARGAHLAALSGVGAISRVPVGVIRTQPETRRLLREALEEIYGLALRAGIALPTDTVERTLAFIDGLRAEGTTSLSATCWWAGRRSWRRGAVRLGARLGVEVPVHRVICAALVGRERSARGIG
jgi:2-dehydropantoate 2-reductase